MSSSGNSNRVFKSSHLGIILIILALFEYVSGFSLSTPIYTYLNPQQYNSQIQHYSYKHRINTISMQQSFNPFSARRNSRIRWYEAEMHTFYAFVEEQPLLTAQQELKYGKSIHLSIKIEKIRTELQLKSGLKSVITNMELAESMNTTVDVLEKMTKCAEYSQKKLLNSNLKLVLAVVSRYRQSHIPNAELIAEGTRGLSRAVMRYDYSKGFRFATYATWYVHQAVAEYVRWRKNPTKMPSRYLNLFRKVKLFSAEYKQETNRLPTIKQVAVALNQPEFDIVKILSMHQYPILMCAPVSAQEHYKTEKNDRTYEDILPSKFKIPSKHTESKDLRRDMEKMMLSNLNDVERDVLRLRLGLDDGREKAVKEVGKRFQISWKQVRTVEKEALSKLLCSKEISGFVDSYHSV